MLIARSPMNKASVDIISKYNNDFHPILPICLIFACPAIPTTSVENKRGAIMVFIILRKMSLSTCNFFATSGTSYPNSAPATIHTRIHVVRDLLQHGSLYVWLPVLNSDMMFRMLQKNCRY